MSSRERAKTGEIQEDSRGNPDTSFVLLTLALVGGPHLLGGAPGWSTALLAGAGAVAFASRYLQGRLRAQQLRPDGLEVALFVALLVSVLHALPLPSTWISFLGPATLQHHAETARGLARDVPSWLTFSVDLPRTQERILFGVAVLFAYATARAIAAERGARGLLMGVACSVLCVAVSSVLHQLVRAESVYGVYRPRDAWPIGPLMNPNNLAGFMALGLPILCALIQTSRSWERFGWLSAAALVGAVAVLSKSRGGIVALLLALPLFALLGGVASRRRRAARRRRERRSFERLHDEGQNSRRPERPAWQQRWTTFGAPIAVVAAVSVLGWMFVPLLSDDALVDENYGDLSKLSFFSEQASFLLGDTKRAIFGVGRGAFFASFSAAFTGARQGLYAENLPLQYGVEFGIPVAVGLLSAAAWCVSRAFKEPLSPLRVGALAGVIAIVAQNAVDFSLELTAVALTAAAALGATLAPRRLSSGRRRGTSGKVSAFYPVTAGFGCALVLGLSYSVSASEPARVDSELMSMSDAGDISGFDAAFVPAVQRRPADPSLAVIAAAHAVTVGSPDAAFWLNRSMILAPAWGTPHLWAARWLAEQGRWGQAALEIRSAAESDPPLVRNAICHWLKQLPSARWLFAAAPEAGPFRELILSAGAGCLGAFPSEASQVDEVILSENPDNLPALERRVVRLLTAEPAQALAYASDIVGRWPERSVGYTLSARAQLQLGQADAALAVLEEALSKQVEENKSLLELLARTHARRADAPSMRAAIDRVHRAAPASAEHLAATSRLLGELERSLGNEARALAAFRESYGFVPNPLTLAQAADVAATLGEMSFARRAWRELCDRAPDARRFCERWEQSGAGRAAAER